MADIVNLLNCAGNPISYTTTGEEKKRKQKQWKKTRDYEKEENDHLLKHFPEYIHHTVILLNTHNSVAPGGPKWTDLFLPDSRSAYKGSSFGNAQPGYKRSI